MISIREIVPVAIGLIACMLPLLIIGKIVLLAMLLKSGKVGALAAVLLGPAAFASMNALEKNTPKKHQATGISEPTYYEPYPGSVPPAPDFPPLEIP